MESKKINQLATELAPELSDLTIIGDPTTGISKKITLSQMASLFTGTVEEYASLSAFPLVGTADTIYIALDTNILYRWDTTLTSYVELSPNIVTSLVFNDANGFDGTISLVGSTATLTITTALTQGSVPFIGTSGALTQDNANLFFDDTNNRLGINTNSPTTALDVFGSGIIGRVNGTSTNNAFLGFASAGTNKWSIGNVQSDHRFRIYSEANTSELVSVLQTGEFGIGIANPTTKLHIDGGASALIANLDANVSVAKSISFRSDNSARINLEVSGTESGSNVGADLFIRTYTDAGALLATPLFIKRSTGNIGIGTTTPVQKLNVNGNIRIDGSGLTEFIINNGTNEWEMYMPSGSNDLRFYRGTDKMTLTSGGNVGIGTSSPTGQLSLGSSTLSRISFDWLGDNNSKSQIIVNHSTGENQFYNVANYFPTFYAGGTERMRISTSGNVGIGTSSPASSSGTLLQLGATTIFQNVVGNQTLLSQNAYYDSGWKYLTTANAAAIRFGSLAAGDISFHSSASGTAGATISNWDTSDIKMYIKPSGFVGIQTSGPTCPLHILNLQSSGGLPTLGTIGTGTTAYFCNNNANYGMMFGSLPTGNSWIQVARTDNQAVAYNLILQPLGGSVTVTGSLSKGSGSFKIDHPLESMSETHYLVHSFVESPQANNIYRGKIQLKNGIAEVNLDEVSTMTEGTFVALNREIHTYTSNETDWDAVKGKVEGNILYIECQNNKSTAIVSWLVIGERKDKHIIDTDWTDENGKVIVEPLKSIEEEIIKEEIIENINE
jgi:hypothetical protein